MATILMMEPEARLGTKMCEVLRHAGHDCTHATTIADGLAFIGSSDQRVLTLLNSRMPWKDSFVFLRALEEKGWPVLFVTGDAANAAHLKALNRGNCAVLVSPFDIKRLVGAVSELLKVTDRMLTLGRLRLDVEEKQATLDGTALSLTAQEFALLQALMQSPDAPLTREQLLRTAWGYQGIGETRTVDVHIQRLRRKLGSSCIETVYKLGYRLKMA